MPGSPRPAGGSAAAPKQPSGQLNYQWYEPNRVTSVNPGNATQSGNTAAGGTVDFLAADLGRRAEQDHDLGDPLARDVRSRVGEMHVGGRTILDSDVPALVESFTLSGLKVRDHVYCVVRNRFKRSTVRVVKQWVGDPGSTTIFVDATGAAPYDASTVATTSGASASFAYPVSTAARVGETAVPAGYRATIQCEGRGLRRPTTAVRSRSRPRPRTAPPSPARSRTSRIARPSRWSSSGRARPPRRRSSSTRTVRRRSTPRPSRPRAARAPPSRTRPRPRSRWARLRCRTDTAPRFSAARGPTAVYGRAIPGYRAGPAGLTLTCTITNTQKRSTVRVVKQWDGAPRRRRSSSTRTARLRSRRPPSRPPTGTRRPSCTRSGRRRRSVRPRSRRATRRRSTAAGPAAVQRRAVPGHLPGHRGHHPHLHDHEHAAVLDRARGQAVGRRGRRRQRSSSTRTGDGTLRRTVVDPAHGASASFVYPVSTGRDGR